MKKKWPSGVPVFSTPWSLWGPYQVGVDVDGEFILCQVCPNEKPDMQFWRREDELEAANADARAMLAIARGGR